MQTHDKLEGTRNRRKKILSNREVPLPTGHKLVWVVNKQGNVFLPFQPSNYIGDPDLKTLCNERVIQPLNKEIAIIWSTGQELSRQTELHTSVRLVLKAIILVLIVTLLALALTEHRQSLNFIFIVSVVLIWLICCIMAAYIYCTNYEHFDTDSRIVSAVLSKLWGVNQEFMRKDLCFRCDSGATWICLSPWGQETSSEQSLAASEKL